MQAALQNKHAVLVAQRDQLVSQINMTIGAIAIIEELLGEAAAEESRRLATEAQSATAAREIAEEARTAAATAQHAFEEDMVAGGPTEAQLATDAAGRDVVQDYVPPSGWSEWNEAAPATAVARLRRDLLPCPLAPPRCGPLLGGG